MSTIAPEAGPLPAPDTPDPTITPTSALPTHSDPPLSKTQRKKLAKQAAWEAAKPARKAADKARKKAKAAERRAKRDAGELDEDEQGPSKKKQKVVQQAAFKATVVIDCDFDELMTEKEIASMQQQLSHSYSVNRHAVVPFERIIISSLAGKLKERCDKVYPTGDHLRWTRVEHTESSWSDLPLEKDSLVYLTADSPEVLEELEEGKVYIIGGIVDRNRHKNICYDRARAAGIRHAQLPFGSYMSELKTRKVLTVNQVFHILSVWLSERDWRTALEEVVPLRKMRDAGAGVPAAETQAEEAETGEVVVESEVGPAVAGPDDV